MDPQKQVRSNPRFFRVLFIAVNVFSVIIGIAAYFVAANFLVTFFGTILIANAAWYYITHIKQRVTSIQLDQARHQLILEYNKGEERNISLDHLKFKLEKHTDHNGSQALFAIIMRDEKLLHKFKPAAYGFNPDALSSLAEEVRNSQNATDETVSTRQSGAL